MTKEIDIQEYIEGKQFPPTIIKLLEDNSKEFNSKSKSIQKAIIDHLGGYEYDLTNARRVLRNDLILLAEADDGTVVINRWRKLKMEERRAKKRSMNRILNAPSRISADIGELVQTWIGKSMLHGVDEEYQRNEIDNNKKHILAVIKAMDGRELIGLEENLQTCKYLLDTILQTIEQVYEDSERQEKLGIGEV